MLSDFLAQAHQDLPVFISDVRADFQSGEGRPFHIYVQLYDGTVRVFPLIIPQTTSREETDFIASYIHATIYNILSSLGALRIDLYFDTADSQLSALVATLPVVFQVDLPKAQRSGYGKCLNVNERILAAIAGNSSRFCFRALDIRQAHTPPKPAPKAHTEQTFADLPAKTKGRVLLGIDIGGTDIKLVVSVDGRLAWCKEYDWFPTSFDRSDLFIDVIVILIRLMRNAANYTLTDSAGSIDCSAMHKDATLDEITCWCETAEAWLPAPLRQFDGIGISFPDVVIRNRIVGGETYKTKGIRDNKAVDYEIEFGKITMLYEALLPFVSGPEKIRITNDGPMAAFTVAVEQAFADTDVSNGVFAHTLGTELGTGWVECDGTIPEIPLEVYNFIIDLGSFQQREYSPDDIRSTINFNTLLPGTLQKYTSQYGAYRLAAKYMPDLSPALQEDALQKGLIRFEGKKMLVPTQPQDMRKPYLEYLMDKAVEGEPVCQRIFREIGQFLSVTWEETTFILEPEATERTLFGRLVKKPICFQLICEGAHQRTPELVQHAADGSLANTELMKQLETHPDYSVAQFAQAVGAVYFACLGMSQ